MIKAVVFDMDGVLFDSELFYIKRTLECLHHFKVEATLEDIRSVAGGNTNHYRNAIAPLVEPIGMTFEQFDDYAWQTYKERPTPYEKILFPDTYEVLDYLSSRYRLVLATSSKSFEVADVFKRIDIEKYFEFVLTGDMFKEAKPNPDIYLTCIRKLGLQPEEIRVVEDSEYGITAAKNAGLYVFARRDDRFGFDQSKADQLIDTLSELKNYL
ncbi:MAG: HAD family phosphatase [Erysipelotrichaceae bacterium]|nr:HAD family phosphatase [Erysipelotrichaceae bacterium]